MRRPCKHSKKKHDLFECLPDDLLVLILSKLSSTASSPSDFINIILTCKRLNRLGLHRLVLSKAASKLFAIKPKNWSEYAHSFLKHCANAGNVDACYTLGMIRFYCLKNRGSGLSLMAKAAMKLHAPALYSLAVIQFNGSGGSKRDKDLRAGVALSARASLLGHIDALRELGHCLQDGYGVRQNVTEGRRLLVQANVRELAYVLRAIPRGQIPRLREDENENNGNGVWMASFSEVWMAGFSKMFNVQKQIIQHFFYAMPMSRTKVFFEETCLASKDAMPFDLLKKKMFSRLNTMGIRIKKTYEEEWSYIPVGGSLPNTEQKNLAFGAAASMFLSTGYSVVRSLSEAPKYVSVIASILKDDHAKDIITQKRRKENLSMQVSNSISFANPKAPVYPRLALGKSWDEVSVWSKKFSFKTSPYPGQNSLQRAIIFGDMGKYVDYQPGSLNTTDQLIKDLDYYDIVFHIGDMPYANGYTSHGNHDRDWPNTGSLFDTPDSGGECGVFAETMYYFPAENRAKFWYKADYGLFRFCVADSEHDWREGSEQYKFIEHCLATIDRKHQPWLIFSAHRPLDYSSNDWYGKEGSFEEPMGRESLQKLWQKYKVEIPFYGHVHNYERMCPIYQNQCVNQEKFNHSYLLFEYKRSSDGKVYDSFTISRDYRDVLACVHDGCEKTTLAT
ncbi:Putative inactive purple acid phosphatase 27 [Glycine soja]|uniref:Putative inactive purple acid phosphatase 27 n=1 Tax=Glycine soja TaxID=3848 RepID=A0A0B2QQV8_GLYSO|nr:Putative inactive purple acid phosphatase 27 [Glycine soja]